uniref:L-type lectin-domain containing receptor kinase IX.1-like n=1 Tax=Erigeron canadensis TaxID=72917 RepID=UPI001CB8B798|nr:L-type lectin-domain containing receptor kinase IX.1-like [Erigeron canadensis]
MAILIYFLLVLIIPHKADSLSFDFPNLSPLNQNTDIVTMADAFITTDGMQLIPDRSYTAGRGIYNSLLHLWDKTSGNLASFSTNFSFVIESDTIDPIYADGLTFFLAENNSVATIGGALGLPVANVTYKNLSLFVAVEFDTYTNGNWDPAEFTDLDHHAGINVNSLTSRVFRKWSINITKGAQCQASITYDSVLKNLGVSVTDDLYGVIDLSHIIDLRDELPEWVIFGFSAGGGLRFEKVTLLSWSFSSSNLQVAEHKTPPPGPAPKNGPGHKLGLIVGLVAVLLFSTIIVFYYLWRRKHRRHEMGYDADMNKDFEHGTGPKRFSYNEILQATGGFAETNKLGEGGFGGVYKGFLKDSDTYIAVKRVSKTSQQGIKEYTAEVKIISRLRHKNLVELKGWCHEKSELLLVYEFMENGSLDLHLFKQKSLLTWDKRKRIAYGLGSALLYLHEECKECILHRDIKSSNVMLGSNFNVRLGDFGLAKLVDHEKGSQTTMLAGTLGYMAPEYVVTGKASKGSDVYSFGVVALEIACGRKSIDNKAQERQVKLVEWVWDLYGTGSILEAFDRSLGSDYTEEIERLVIVGLWCAHPHANQRPTMRQAIQVLNSEASLPILPLKMPKITLNAPPSLSEFGDYSSSTTGSIMLQSKLTVSANSSPAELLFS